MLASSCHAQPAASVPSPRERTIMAQSFTTERLSVWQKRLKLQDWDIAVVMSRTGDLKPKTLGNIHWDTDKKEAVIHVLDPADYRLPFHDMLDDMEFTVVHELIHLKLAPLLSNVPRSEASRRDEEHTVNQLADALLGK
ncbi:MAG: hypothetical protein LAQ30_13040 [Acidobacteriia bacterium]|nr:hypothetical protein [Terriglobia bacterium]